jgi:lysylphosphatidylglycerol synthetase-like protein (DUF2156 family)
MAHKKRKVGKIKRHRRKKVSGITDVVMQGVAITVGGLTAAFGVQAINTAVGASMPAWAAPAGVAAVGVVLPMLLKNNKMAEAAGAGIFAVGAVMAVNQFGLNVPGISGMAMSSNAGPQSTVLRQAVGSAPRMNGYMRNTVGRHPVGAIGQLVDN